MIKQNESTYLNMININDYSNEQCLVSTICNILNMPQKNIYLDSIKNFKNNVLKKDIKYKKIVNDFEFIEPMISKALKKDVLSERIAIICFERYIGPIRNLIHIKDYDTAIMKYKYMINTLRNIYVTEEKSISKKLK